MLFLLSFFPLVLVKFQNAGVIFPLCKYQYMMLIVHWCSEFYYFGLACPELIIQFSVILSK